VSRAERQGARHAREGRPCAPSRRWTDAQVDAYLKGYTSEPNPGADYVICKAWSTSGVFDKFWLAAAS
jgi:hypothetical protein